MALEIKNITKSYDGLKALNEFSVTIGKPTVTGIIGPNGAGKTTLFNIITGLLKADAGVIKYNGREITNHNIYSIAQKGIARTFQNTRLFPQMTVLDNMLLATKYEKGESLKAALLKLKAMKEEEWENKETALNLLEMVGLKDKKDALASELSHGQKKLLELARALATDAELYLLDEPTAGVFPEMKIKILEVIKNLKESGKAVLFIEHDMPVVKEISDRIIVLNYGEVIADGKPEEIERNEEVIKAYLGEDEDE